MNSFKLSKIISSSDHRKGLTVFTMVCVMFMLLSPVHVCAASAHVDFGSETYEKKIGETLTVGVYIRSDFGTSAYNVILKYDNVHLKYIDGADACDASAGKITLAGGAGGTSVRRMIRFEALKAGNSGIYAESAAINYAVMESAVDALGNPVVGPTGEVATYDLSGLDTAAVVIAQADANANTNTNTNTDSQTDSTTEAEDEAEETVTEVEISEESSEEVQDEEAEIIPEETVEPASDNGTTEESAPAETVVAEEPVEETTPAELPSEYQAPIVYNTFIVFGFAVLFVILWIDIIIIISRRSEAARKEKIEEEQPTVPEIHNEEVGLQFADIEDENMNYVEVIEDSPTQPLQYEEIEEELKFSDD